jgi:hypothetical protein
VVVLLADPPTGGAGAVRAVFQKTTPCGSKRGDAAVSAWNNGRLAANILGVVVGFLGSSLLAPLLGHDGKDLESEWYRSLYNSYNIRCCGPSHDCRVVAGYRMEGDHYDVFFENRWLPVLPAALLQRSDNPTGRPVACIGYVGDEPYVRCFVRPAEG